MKEMLLETKIGLLSLCVNLKENNIVFMSGAGQIPTYENFWAVIDHLPENYGFVTIDFPNAGRSPLRDQAGTSIDDWVQAVGHVIERLGLETYALCVHSISGLLAVKLLKIQEGCKKLVTIEPTTKAVLSGEITYDFDITIEDVKATSASHLPKEVNESLWDWAAKSLQAQEAFVGQGMEFQETCHLELEDFSEKLSEEIPHVLFTQAVRLEEYQASEYLTGQTKIVTGGEQHYLQWTQAKEIADALEY